MPVNKGLNPRVCIHIASAVSMALIVAFAVYCWMNGAFSSPEQLQEFVAGYGIAAGLVFVLIQIVQVVIPILPGGVSCLAGVILFGAVAGFIYNYIGICIGSTIAFLLARLYGKPLLYKLFKPKDIEKYEALTSSKSKFLKLFALLIFLPGAPDDMLCFLAGTTKIKLKTFVLMIVLCKPVSIAAYSIGLDYLFSWITRLFH